MTKIILNNNNKIMKFVLKNVVKKNYI